MRVPNLEHEISGWERYFDTVQAITPTSEELKRALVRKTCNDLIFTAFAVPEEQIGKLCGRDN